jgi:aspartate racemase
VHALDAVGEAIRRHGVTTLWLTAGLFHVMVEQRAEDLAPLRQLVAGGGVLSPSHVQKALGTLRDGVVINGYGPTESTTFACCFRMTKSYQAGDNIPIGRPISNTTVYVLDDELCPVSVGEPGELYIGGDGLSNGYLNNPELTREKFIPDPFSAEPSARLYRTGDRVRRRPDGNLEFLGRFDDQVKILGHRIEPGEIEVALQQHPMVCQSVVVAHAAGRNEKQLVAYVTTSSPCGFSSDELKRFLAARLPHYMVPGQIVRMESLPLNRNGKVDRSALPAPERRKPDADGSARPATGLEEKITALWGRILGCRVGLDDNFFDLGGTSLRLIEMHAELTRDLTGELSITELFEYPTVRSLARRLAGMQSRVDPAFARVQDRARRQKEAFTRHRLLKGGVP